MKWHELHRVSGGEGDQLFDTETKERRSWTCGLPHPRHSLHPPRSFLPSSDLTHTQGNTHSGWMVVIRTSVRSLRASSGLSGQGHYHWLISGFWSTLAALRISHFFLSRTHLGTASLRTHTIDCHLGMIATPPLPYRVRAMGSSHCGEIGEG